jgi:hypothetical protein
MAKDTTTREGIRRMLFESLPADICAAVEKFGPEQSSTERG